MAVLLLAQLHEIVEAEGVGHPVDGVKQTGHENALENLIVGQAGRSQGIDVLIGHLVGVFRELDAEPEQRLVLLLDRQRLDIRGFGRRSGFLAASYGPQEK